MSETQTMSFAQTYVLASKVRTKLTKDASNANVPLRNLVVQANMLDNLMDHIADENNKRLDKLNQVKFEMPQRQRSGLQTEITEYEVSSESDSDSDLDEYDSPSDSDDYYYSSEEEEEEQENVEIQQAVATPFKLATIEEMPELTRDDSEESDYDSDDEEVFSSHNLGLNVCSKNMSLFNREVSVSEVY